MSIYQPYTYLIGWTKHNKWYYGCQYANRQRVANPSNLWTNYFTSSKYVKECRELYGEPDVIQVRLVAKNPETIKRCEERILKKIRAAESEQWLNKHNGGKDFQVKPGQIKASERRKRRIGDALRNVPKTAKHCEALSEAHKGQTPWNKGKKTGQVPWNKGVKLGPNPEHSERMKKRGLPKQFDQTGKTPWNKGMRSEILERT